MLIPVFAGKSLVLGKRRTPRQAKRLIEPQRFKFEIYTANLLFMCCVGLAYSCLAPILAVVAAVIAALFNLVYRYQLTFVFETPNHAESGGVSSLSLRS